MKVAILIVVFAIVAGTQANELSEKRSFSFTEFLTAVKKGAQMGFQLLVSKCRNGEYSSILTKANCHCILLADAAISKIQGRSLPVYDEEYEADLQERGFVDFIKDKLNIAKTAVLNYCKNVSDQDNIFGYHACKCAIRN